MRRDLPPLNALKSFEAAARTGGFVLAARELGVSAAAVSQQVKNLEAFFGKQLFLRHNNRVTLTDAGMAVYQDCAGALERLADMTARVMETEVRARLVISLLPSQAARWMNRRLGDFVARHPGALLDIRVEGDPVDFIRHNIDVRICYGDHLYPDLVNNTLVRDEVLPVCAPDFAAPAEPAELDDGDLIHTNWGPSFASHPLWADWFAEAGAARTPDAGQGHRVGQSSLALDLARGGGGIALGQRLLAADDLAAGRLLAPYDLALPLMHPYCAVHTHSKAAKPGVRDFVSWLADIVAPDD